MGKESNPRNEGRTCVSEFSNKREREKGKKEKKGTKSIILTRNVILA